MTFSALQHDRPAPDFTRSLGLHAETPGAIAVLLLEDSGFDAEALRRDCRRTDLPIDLVVVDDLGSFRAAVGARLFDLVLLDYLLPEGDGLMARRLLRRAPRNAEVPTVLISNEVRPEMVHAARDSGCFDCLAKERLDPGRLRDLVLRATTPLALRGLRPRPDALTALCRFLEAEQQADPGRLRAALAALAVAGGRGADDWSAALRADGPGAGAITLH